jgi:hypothetical protein
MTAKRRNRHSPQQTYGADGWPLEPRDPSTAYWIDENTTPEGYKKRRVDLRLNGLQLAWLEGNVRAAPVALRFCREENIAPPQWVTDAVEQLAAWHLSPPKKRQGEGNRDDELHGRRWDLVTSLIDNNGLTLEAAIFEAVALLEGTADACGESMMRKSYNTVRLAIRNGNGARFFVF